MPKTLFKYILMHFWGSFLFILGLFLFLVVMADVIDQLNDFLTYDLSILDITRYYMYMLPTVIVFLIPMAVLLSVLRLFRMMSISNGYIALIMGGIPLRKILIPIAASAALLCALTWVFSNQVGPETRFKKKVFQKTRLKLHRPVLRGVSLTGDEGLIYYLNEYHKKEQKIVDLMVTAYSTEGKLQKRIFAEVAVWQEDHWDATDVHIQPYNSQGLPLEGDHLDHLNLGPMKEPAEILLPRKDPKYLTAKQLWDLSQQVPEDKLRMKAKLLLDYYRKFAVVFLPLIIVAIAVPFGVAPLKDTSSKSIGMGVVLSLAYYILDALFYQAGKGMLFSPWIAAWSANFCFTGLGISLMWRMPR